MAPLLYCAFFWIDKYILYTKSVQDRFTVPFVPQSINAKKGDCTSQQQMLPPGGFRALGGKSPHLS